MSRPPFHLAVPVDDLDAGRRFYVETFDCKVGRESEHWVDLDFFGHQLTLHRIDGVPEAGPFNEVDGKQVPVRHFGAVLPWTDWHALAARLEARGLAFVIEPGIRFAGEVGEQATLFVRDPAGNAIELKSFRDATALFARREGD